MRVLNLESLNAAGLNGAAGPLAGGDFSATITTSHGGSDGKQQITQQQQQQQKHPLQGSRSSATDSAFLDDVLPSFRLSTSVAGSSATAAAAAGSYHDSSLGNGAVSGFFSGSGGGGPGGYASDDGTVSGGGGGYQGFAMDPVTRQVTPIQEAGWVYIPTSQKSNSSKSGTSTLNSTSKKQQHESAKIYSDAKTIANNECNDGGFVSLGGSGSIRDQIKAQQNDQPSRYIYDSLGGAKMNQLGISSLDTSSSFSDGGFVSLGSSKSSKQSMDGGFVSLGISKNHPFNTASSEDTSASSSDSGFVSLGSSIASSKTRVEGGFVSLGSSAAKKASVANQKTNATAVDIRSSEMRSSENHTKPPSPLRQSIALTSGTSDSVIDDPNDPPTAVSAIRKRMSVSLSTSSLIAEIDVESYNAHAEMRKRALQSQQNNSKTIQPLQNEQQTHQQHQQQQSSPPSHPWHINSTGTGGARFLSFKPSPETYLGEGRYAEVYQASYLGRKVAVKRLHPDADALSLALAEVHMLRLFNHDNILCVYDFFSEDELLQQSSSHNLSTTHGGISPLSGSPPRAASPVSTTTATTSAGFTSYSLGLPPLDPEIDSRTNAKHQQDRGMRRSATATSAALTNNSFKNHGAAKLPAYLLVLEFCENGSLWDLIQGKPHLFDVLHWLDFAFQLVSAVQEVHSYGIVHHDIKPHNILVTENMQLKLSDFANACYLPRLEQKDADGKLIPSDGTPLYGALHDGLGRGTTPYTAPELLFSSQYHNAGYGLPSDIYSTGIVLWCMLSGREPFFSVRMPAMMLTFIKRGFFSSGINLIPSHFLASPSLSSTSSNSSASFSLPSSKSKLNQNSTLEQSLAVAAEAPVPPPTSLEHLTVMELGISSLLEKCMALDPAERPTATQLLATLTDIRSQLKKS